VTPDGKTIGVDVPATAATVEAVIGTTKSLTTAVDTAAESPPPQATKAALNRVANAKPRETWLIVRMTDSLLVKNLTQQQSTAAAPP